MEIENPNGTKRKHIKNMTHVLDGNQIRTYTRSNRGNEVSDPKTQTFTSVAKAQRAFDAKR